MAGSATSFTAFVLHESGSAPKFTKFVLYEVESAVKRKVESTIDYDVVTTLGFGCILFATSDVVFPTSLLRPKANVVTTLSF